MGEDGQGIGQVLAGWEIEPASQEHALLSQMFRYEVLEEGGEGYSAALEWYEGTSIVGDVDASGATLLGVLEAHTGLGGPLVMLCFASLAGRARLVVHRRAESFGLIEGQENDYDVDYSLSTLFDDGSAVTTWGKANPLSGESERYESRPGVGRVAQDVAAHAAAVATRASAAA